MKTTLAGALASDIKHGQNLKGGGFHHAKPEVGEGFCIIADVPIAIKVLQKEGLIKRALIIDIDIHQGNGTIVCLQDDETIFTFSMHEGGIYPIPKEKGDRDVEVAAGVTDEVYLKTLKAEIDSLFKKSKSNIVFHVAGCDALANGRMSHEGIAKRDAMVVDIVKMREILSIKVLRN